MLHIHVLLIAPLGTGYMAQPGADQHEGRVTIREGLHHTGPAADLPVQPLNHIVGADPGPVLVGKITVGQRFLNTVLHLFGGLFQLHFPQLGHHGFGLFAGSLLAFLGMDRLEHLSHQFYFGARNNGKHIAVYPHCAEIEAAAKNRMNTILPQLMKHYGVTERLKAANQLEWVRQMNACVAQAEEVIKDELIYS